MATGSPKIKVVVTGDAHQLDRALSKAAGKLTGFGGTFRRVFNERLIGGAFSLLGDAIRGAFDFAQTGLDNFDKLGDALAIVEANASGLADVVSGIDLTKLGFDKIETATAAEDISSAAKAIGLTRKESAKLVPDLLTAAAAYSALTGKDAKTSGDIFAKALGGSAKAAKELGVKFAKTDTPAQRVAKIMAKWGPLAKEAADGTRTLADEQATLDAKMSDLSTSVGGFLDSALQPLIAGLVNDLIPALQAFWEQHGPAILDAFGKIGAVIGTVAGFVINELVPVFLDLYSVFAEKVVPKILAFYKLIWEKLQPVLETLWDWFKTTAVPFIKDTLLPAIGDLFDLFTKLAGFVSDVLSVAFDTLAVAVDGIDTAVGDALDLIGDLIDAVASAPIISDFLSFVSGNPKAVGRAVAPFTLAPAGGVGSSRSATRAGASGAPSGGVSVHISMGVGDPVAVGREVAKVLRAYRSRGGTI